MNRSLNWNQLEQEWAQQEAEALQGLLSRKGETAWSPLLVNDENPGHWIGRNGDTIFSLFNNLVDLDVDKANRPPDIVLVAYDTATLAWVGEYEFHIDDIITDKDRNDVYAYYQEVLGITQDDFNERYKDSGAWDMMVIRSAMDRIIEEIREDWYSVILKVSTVETV